MVSIDYAEATGFTPSVLAGARTGERGIGGVERLVWIRQLRMQMH
jgi:hypothetical protein